MRDEFTQRTIATLAKRVGYLCSNPECRMPTVAGAPDHDGVVNVGVAAHITAAAPAGPRYDPALTRDQRRHHSNGIWLCQTHGKLVDADDKYFTVELLRGWKQSAEARALKDILAPTAKKVGLGISQDSTVRDRGLEDASKQDLSNFKQSSGWPLHPVELNLRMSDGEAVRAFRASEVAIAIETFKELVIVAPPGTGKTITLLQASEAILQRGNRLAIFVPLSEWSSQPATIFQSILRRRAFREFEEKQLTSHAESGRLVLALDGWNELDIESKKRASGELNALRRDFEELGIIVSTRRQALDVPFSGPSVEIDVLTEEQQREIARSQRGTIGEEILDRAWRTPGVRELVAVPLYLATLLARIPGSAFPSTKEEVLRLFLAAHEKAPDKAEELRRVLFGFQTEFLTALAVQATQAANTAIAVTTAHSVIRRAEDGLVSRGQLTSAPQPVVILDALVNQHMLVRSGSETAGVSFQHQQFQEWYASLEVERLMLASDAGVEDAAYTLKSNVLNIPEWEEAILFASERLSRTDDKGTKAVASAILDALLIEPLLAAEMIHRSASRVWDQIREPTLQFAQRWHVRGRVDRAIAFMITTGRPEFATEVWGLVSDPNTQIHLTALRAGRRFRPSVLGSEIGPRIKLLSPQLRTNIISEIARLSGIEGMELAAELAQTDGSAEVQVSVIRSFQFRRADRFADRILRTAPDEVWQILARKGSIEEISDPELQGRLLRARQRNLETEVNPLSKIRMLIDSPPADQFLGPEIASLIQAPNFPFKDQYAALVLQTAHKLVPQDVRDGLLRRIQTGLEIPFGSEPLLLSSEITVEDGPLASMVTQLGSTKKRVAEVAAGVVGPATVGKLLSLLVALENEIRSKQGAVEDQERQRHFHLVDLISKTKLYSFVSALLGRPITNDPHEIAIFADLVARHGEGEQRGPLRFENELHEQLVALVARWANNLASEPTANRGQLSELARAIGRLAAPQLFPALQQLFEHDLTRWRRAREEFLKNRGQGRSASPDDARISYSIQYRNAFAAIGDHQVVELMTDLLRDPDFGFDAACVLLSIWQRQHGEEKELTFAPWPDFSQVRERRVARGMRRVLGPSSSFADAILAVVADLIQSEADSRIRRRALQLAKIAFSMPYNDQAQLIEQLLQLPEARAEKQGLLVALVLAGETVRADMILDSVKTLLEEATGKPWLLDQNRGELERWLELLPFSDRPSAVMNALDMLGPNLKQPWRYRGLLRALGVAPGPEAESALSQLPGKHAGFLDEDEWLTALENRGTLSAIRVLLDYVPTEAANKPTTKPDNWAVSRMITGAIRNFPGFRREVYETFDRLQAGPRKTILEQAIANVADEEGVLLLVRSYANQRHQFDHTLRHAIRNSAVGERPAADWPGTSEAFRVPIPNLRKRLFEMTGVEGEVAEIATACLIATDEIRDEYGPAEAEPFHPDIDSGRPWPLPAD